MHNEDKSEFNKNKNKPKIENSKLLNDKWCE